MRKGKWLRLLCVCVWVCGKYLHRRRVLRKIITNICSVVSPSQYRNDDGVVKQSSELNTVHRSSTQKPKQNSKIPANYTSNVMHVWAFCLPTLSITPKSQRNCRSRRWSKCCMNYSWNSIRRRRSFMCCASNSWATVTTVCRVCPSLIRTMPRVALIWDCEWFVTYERCERNAIIWILTCESVCIRAA